jgi:hypothetical protein
MNGRLLLLATVLLHALASTSHAQPIRHEMVADIEFLNDFGELQSGVRCAAPPVNKKQAKQAEAEAALTRELLGPGGPRTIPVVFHVLRSRNEGNVPIEQIEAQIDVLNGALSGAGYSFVLAGVNRVNNRKWFTGCYSVQTEAQMKNALAVDPATTLNIYTCKPSSGILGYAYLPWSLPENDPLHGVVLLYSSLPGGTAAPYNQGDTATHEVGHYLGLYHTFQNGCAAPGDSVSDTAPEASAAYGCPVGRDTCAGGGPDPIFNFMDYSDDACMDHFTLEQGTRMQNLVMTYKPGLRCGDGVCNDDAEEDGCICPDDCIASPAAEGNCSDEIDNDCDGLVDANDDDCNTDGGGGGGGSCLDRGASCSGDSECCSSKCKGPQGSKTCR